MEAKLVPKKKQREGCKGSQRQLTRGLQQEIECLSLIAETRGKENNGICRKEQEGEGVKSSVLSQKVGLLYQ